LIPTRSERALQFQPYGKMQTSDVRHENNANLFKKMISNHWLKLQ